MALTWYPVLRFPLDKDLMPLLAHLRRQQVRFHVTEEKGEQQLWIDDPVRVMEVAETSAQWAAGDLQLAQPDVVLPKRSLKILPTLARLFLRVPVSCSVILLGVVGALLVAADPAGLRYVAVFLFQPLVQQFFLPPGIGWQAGEYWRLLTPMFIHFGPFHILFNSMVLWAMGTRIEIVKGSGHYLLMLIIVSMVANASQYLAHPNTAFGGLSGVVYGVIGYIALYQTFITHPILQFNKAAIAFFLVWLLLGFAGIIDWFIVGSVANTAHLAGLLAGAACGGLMVIRDHQRNV